MAWSPESQGRWKECVEAAGTGTHGLVSCGERHLGGKPEAIATDESRQEETQPDWCCAGGGISGIVERWSPQDFLVTRCRSREMVGLSATYGHKHNGQKSRTRQGGKGSGKTSCIQKVLNTCLYITGTQQFALYSRCST